MNVSQSIFSLTKNLNLQIINSTALEMLEALLVDIYRIADTEPPDRHTIHVWRWLGCRLSLSFHLLHAFCGSVWTSVVSFRFLLQLCHIYYWVEDYFWAYNSNVSCIYGLYSFKTTMLKHIYNQCYSVIHLIIVCHSKNHYNSDIIYSDIYILSEVHNISF